MKNQISVLLIIGSVALSGAVAYNFGLKRCHDNRGYFTGRVTVYDPADCPRGWTVADRFDATINGGIKNGGLTLPSMWECRKP